MIYDYNFERIRRKSIECAFKILENTFNRIKYKNKRTNILLYLFGQNE